MRAVEGSATTGAAEAGQGFSSRPSGTRVLDVEKGIRIPAGREVDGLDGAGRRAAHQPTPQAALQAADASKSSAPKPRRAALDVGRRGRFMRLSATSDDAARRPASYIGRVLLEALRRCGGPRLEAAPTPSRT